MLSRECRSDGNTFKINLALVRFSHRRSGSVNNRREKISSSWFYFAVSGSAAMLVLQSRVCRVVSV